MKFIIAGLTLFFSLTQANVFATDDPVDAFTETTKEPINFFTEAADEPFNLYTEALDDPLSFSTGELIASAQVDCQSNGDIDNLFLSDGVARVRRRRDACPKPSPPPPYTDIYDSNGILNQLSPQTLPKIPDKKEENILNLEQLWRLPSLTPSTDGQEQDDICPKELVGDSQKPVCSSERPARDALRLPREDWYTLYNVRHCMSQALKFTRSRYIHQLIHKILFHSVSPDSPCVDPEGFWCCFSVEFAVSLIIF